MICESLTIAAKIRFGRQIGDYLRIFEIALLVRCIAFVSKFSRAATSPTTAFFFFSSSGFHVLFSAGSALVSTVGRVTFSNASTSNYDRWSMSLTVSFGLSVKCFLEKFTRVAVTFSESNLWNIFWIRNARLGSWFRSLGEWRFERKCFRANRETIAAKIRDGRRNTDVLRLTLSRRLGGGAFPWVKKGPPQRIWIDARIF